MISRACIVLATAVALTSPSQANAAVISFDDLPTPTSDIRILGRYANLHWTDVGLLNGASQPAGSGYHNSVMSAPNIAYTYANRAASFSNEFAFTLVSMGVTKAIRAGVTHFEGYQGDQLRYSLDVYSTPATPQLVIFNWDDITKIVISDGDGSLQSAFDNITVIGLVPEPASGAMLLAGLGLLMWKGRRRAHGTA